MRRGWLFVLVLFAALLPATPALAAPHLERYAFVDSRGDGGIGYVDIEGMRITICKQCGLWISIRDKAGNPQVGQVMLGGLQKFAQARSASDPAVAARFDAAALEQFSAAARLGGPDGLVLADVGIFDIGRRVAEPEPSPWLSGAGQHLVDGVALLQRASVESDPHPWVEAAVARFTTAYRELAAKEAIAG